MRRSRTERIAAGVCGGLARSLGLDPVLVRVLVAVLALLGGAGVVLYVVGWLLLPVDDGQRSIAERAFARPAAPGPSRPIGLAVLLVVLALVSLALVFDAWEGSALLVLSILGLLLWIDRRSVRVEHVVYAAAEPAPIGGGGLPPASGWSQPVDPPPGTPLPGRPRPVLFAVTASCVLIAVGALGAADGAGLTVPAGAYPALALAVVGLGLVVGTWFDRSRGLIVVGLVLALMTGGAVGADRVGRYGRDSVDLMLRPTSVDSLPTAAEYAVGSARYDLTGIEFGDTDTTMRVSIGAGEIVVTVPPEVDVTVKASVGVGETLLFSDGEDGPGVDRTVTDLGPDGAGGGSLDLFLDAGVGHLEVRRG